MDRELLPKIFATIILVSMLFAGTGIVFGGLQLMAIAALLMAINLFAIGCFVLYIIWS